MSLIEGDVYFPLFSTSEIPIDFSAAGLVPDSPGKFPQFTAARRASILANAANSQTVPAHFAPLDEPLFSVFMNGTDKMDLNSGFAKGFQIPEELLLQTSMVPDNHKDSMMMGMDQRQFVQMGIIPEPMQSTDFVPQMNQTQIVTEDKSPNGKKRKFVQATKEMPEPSTDGQSLTPEEERNMKRQRRLVKNREAAQLFRQRQKAYIQDLEKKVADLSATNNDHRARVELLNSENKLIKEQLLYLRNFITQAVSFSFPKSPGSEGDSSPASLLGPLPAGLTLPPEILGAMGNMPNMAAGLMGALPNFLMPGQPNFVSDVLSGLPPNFPQIPLQQVPTTPSMEPHAIKLPSKPVNINQISPVSVPTAIPIVPSLPPIPLIPSPARPLNMSHNNANAVVPQFHPTSPQVPESSMVKLERAK